MCLTTVDSIPRPCTKGYKVMYQGKGKLYGADSFEGQHITRPRKRWLDATHYNVVTVVRTYNAAYPAGFHVFRYLRDARRYIMSNSNEVVVKVKVKEPLCSGTQLIAFQRSAQITVCRYIKIEQVL